MSRKKGFTLIELLVVIAIIALLLSIILPSLSKAKGIARRLICSSGQHQLGLAMLSYANNNDSKFPAVKSPSSGGWLFDVPLIAGNAIIDYAQQDVMFCPSNHRGKDIMQDYYAILLKFPDENDRPDPQKANSGWGITDYMWMLSWGYRTAISDKLPYGGKDIFIAKSTDKGQSNKPVITDIVWTMDGGDFSSVNSTAKYPETGLPAGPFPSNHINGTKAVGGNQLYIDGHSDWIKFDAMSHHYTAGGTLQHWW